MLKRLPIFGLALIIYSCNNNLTCSDFKEGSFKILGDSIFEEYNTLRQGNQLIEFVDGSQHISTIEYIDECTHLIRFPKDTSGHTGAVGVYHATGEIRVEVERISGDSLFYNSILENDTFRFVQPGIVVKIGEIDR